MSIRFKKIYFIIYIIINVLQGVSAPPHVVNIEQLDGSKIPVRMHGHEYYNWIETIDGHVIQLGDDGNWYYSELDDHGNYVTSNVLVTYPAPFDLSIPIHLKEKSPKVRKLSNKHGKETSSHDFLLRENFADASLKPLVLLVDFDDEEHTYTASQFEHLIFAEDLSPNEAGFPSDHVDYTMSVRDYYDEISNGKQQIIGGSGSVIDWQRAKNNYSYYVDGAQGTAEGVNGFERSAAALIVEAAMGVDDSFDFSEFNNGAGAIDVVILIVAGKGGMGNDYFWPHMFVVPSISSGLLDINPNAPVNSSGYFFLDGVVIRKYIVIHEKYAWNADGAGIDMIHPIGTICHELGHVLGLPDLYDTSVNSYSGIGAWGLMGSGNYKNQTSPAYMSAWSRYRLGYIDPIIIEDETETIIDILPAESHEDAIAYLLPMDSNLPQEYLLLENRQQVGSDQFLPGSGLLVWHVDEIITDMYPAINSVNVNPDFYGVNLLQADGLDELYSSFGNADSDDPFQNGDGPLNETSNPNTDLYDYDRSANGFIDNGGKSNIEVNNISINNDGMVSAVITNPNKNGNILSFDEGNYEGIAFPKVEGQLEWAGIKFNSPSNSLLSGVQMALPPSYSLVGNVTSYVLNIWSGWSGNKPENLLFSMNENVNWNSTAMRDGGFAFLSLIDQNITLERGFEYYFEINFEGSGYVYFFDQGLYGTNQSDGKSYYRSDIYDNCIPLSSQNAAQKGDWNLRVILSGKNCGNIDGQFVWPGDTDGDMDVDANDIIPIGISIGSQGCPRIGDSYSWEEMPFPDGFDTIEATRADANGDGFVSIADVLVILVNWGKSVNESFMRIDDLILFHEMDLEKFRDNFYQIYLSLNGSSEAEMMIRKKLENMFGFSSQPLDYVLGNNFPNPFNSRTIIPYFMPSNGEMVIEIHNVLGRKIHSSIFNHGNKGWHEFVFDTDGLGSGIYFYMLMNGGNIISQKKMILLK